MSSRLETLIAAVKTRLEAISGTPYTFTVALVERWKHEWDGEEELGNRLGDLPAITMRVLGGDQEDETDGLVSERVSILLQFFFKLEANDDDFVSAASDLKRALFNAFDGYGVGATRPSFSWQTVDSETGPLDCLRATLTSTYQHDLGDPDSRTG